MGLGINNNEIFKSYENTLNNVTEKTIKNEDGSVKAQNEGVPIDFDGVDDDVVLNLEENKVPEDKSQEVTKEKTDNCTYTSDGKIASEKIKDEKGNVTKEIKYSYDKSGNQSGKTVTAFDTNGKKTQIEKYNSKGAITESTTYNATGNITNKKTYENGKVKTSLTNQYDEKGTKTGSTQYAYNTDGKIASKTAKDANGKTTKITTWNYDSKKKYSGQTQVFYDTNGKKTKTVKFNSQNVMTDRTTYNTDGNVKNQKTYENGKIKTSSDNTYDKKGNKTGSTVFNYNSDGKVTTKTVKDKNGKTTKSTAYTYDKNGKQTETTVSDYNSAGKLITKTVSDKNGKTTKTTSYEYDKNGLRSSATVKNSSGKTTAKYVYSYNADKQLTKTTVSKYNSSGKITSKTVTDSAGKTTQTTEYAYNKSGLQTSATVKNAKGEITKQYDYSYDDKGNKTCSTVSEFDSDGKVTSKTVRDKNNKTTEKTTFNYDEKGNISKTTDYKYNSDGKTTETLVKNAKGIPQSRNNYQYDEKGNLTKSEYTSYNSAGRETSCTAKNKNGVIVSKQSYEYDKNGKLSAQTAIKYSDSGEHTSTTKYKYDSSERILSEKVSTPLKNQKYTNSEKSYTYNSTGSITSKTIKDYTYDGKLIGSVTYKYASSYSYTPNEVGSDSNVKTVDTPDTGRPSIYYGGVIYMPNDITVPSGNPQSVTPTGSSTQTEERSKIKLDCGIELTYFGDKNSALSGTDDYGYGDGSINKAVGMGEINDSWLIAGAQSFTRVNNYITKNSNGSVTVSFNFQGKAKKYTISRADLEKAEKSNLSNGDNDMMALEIATILLFKDIGFNAPNSKTKKDDTDYISKGGLDANTFCNLFGSNMTKPKSVTDLKDVRNLLTYYYSGFKTKNHQSTARLTTFKFTSENSKLNKIGQFACNTEYAVKSANATKITIIDTADSSHEIVMSISDFNKLLENGENKKYSCYASYI